MARKSALVIALMAALSASGAQALGLGDIVVRSGLNQPLEAEIPLLSAQDVEVDVMRANLASPEAFERAGVERAYFLNSIRFSPATLSDGRKVLRLRTRDPVKEPFLNFIVEINWPSGRMQREYTLLMDPPVFAERSRAAAVAAPIATGPAQRRVSGGPAPAFTGSYSGEAYGPTGGTDTLWGIANKVRNGHSTAQTMVALYQANPDAFSTRNMNSLKQGQTLKVPSGESIDAVSMAEARRLMIAHNQAWGTRSGVSDEPRAVVEAGQAGAASESAPVETGDGRLKLVTPPSGKDSGDGAIRDRLSGVVEAQETLSKENEELRSQLGQLASQMDKLERLVKLKDEQLAALQAGKTLPAGGAETETMPAGGSAAPTPGQTVPETGEPVATAPTPAPESGTSTPAAAPTAPVTQVSKPKPPATARPRPAPAEPDLLSQILAEPLYLAAGGGALVLLLGLGLFLARRRPAEEEILPVRPAPTVSKPQAATAATGTVAAAAESLPDLDIPDVADTFAVDEPVAAASASSLTNFDNIADPLGEADIYIAYGKYGQAEELLKATLAKDPERHEARLKLLECYAETHNRAAFESEALRLKGAAALDASLVARVAALFEAAWHGERFTLLGEVASAGTSKLPSADDIFANLDVGEAPKAQAPAPDDSSEFHLDESVEQGFSGFGAKPAEEKFEFDLSAGTAAAEHGGALDFTLGELSPPPASQPEDDFSFALHEEPSSPTPQAEETMDFDLADELAMDQGARDDLASLGAEDEDLLAGSDEASTKLDLARAYIDMGDMDGARDILSEVMTEGSLEQKQEAQALLAKLG